MSFLRQHSLSLVLFAGFVFCSAMSYQIQPPEGWAFDFWMMLAGSFGGGLVIVVAAKYFWERGSDPTKPT